MFTEITNDDHCIIQGFTQDIFKRNRSAVYTLLPLHHQPQVFVTKKLLECKPQNIPVLFLLVHGLNKHNVQSVGFRMAKGRFIGFHKSQASRFHLPAVFMLYAGFSSELHTQTFEWF